MNALDLPVEPGALLAGHASRLDEMYREVASRLESDTPATIDEELAAVDQRAMDLDRRITELLALAIS